MDDGLLLAWLPKAVVYICAQLSVGLIVVRGFAPSPFAKSAWFNRCATAASLLLCGALLARVWVQSASAFGASDALLPENLTLIALESRWGGSWRLQAYAAAAMVLFALIPRRMGWGLFAISAIALCLVMPALGHAGGSASRHAIHAIHNLGAAAWLGTVGALAIAAWTWPRAEQSAIGAIVKRFSPLALCAAATVATSGVSAGWLYVGSWDALISTDYGRALLLKLLGVGVIAGCGLVNWRNARRGNPPHRMVMTLEWIAAVVVLILTAQLTETEHP